MYFSDTGPVRCLPSRQRPHTTRRRTTPVLRQPRVSSARRWRHHAVWHHHRPARTYRGPRLQEPPSPGEHSPAHSFALHTARYRPSFSYQQICRCKSQPAIYTGPHWVQQKYTIRHVMCYTRASSCRFTYLISRPSRQHVHRWWFVRKHSFHVNRWRQQQQQSRLQ